jgi:hypothetical protein
MDERAVPLTPALSLRERELNLCVFLEPKTSDIDDRRWTVLPLLEGEGRGERERRVRTQHPTEMYPCGQDIGNT